MGTVVYGTYHFTKLMGYFGNPEQCSNCGRTYKKAVVKDTRWGHLDYIPLLPMGTKYILGCPICGDDEPIDKKTATTYMNDPNPSCPQELKPYIKYDKAAKYREFDIKDVLSGEEICVASDITKSQAKDIAKIRGFKKVETINI